MAAEPIYLYEPQGEENAIVTEYIIKHKEVVEERIRVDVEVGRVSVVER